MPELIAIESHVKDCPPCARELRELQRVGDALRLAAAPGPSDDWTGLAPGVISRMRAESTNPCPRAHPGCSKTCTSCGSAWRRRPPPSSAARSPWARCTSRRPSENDSLAAVIAMLAAPSGSDLNPARLDCRYRVPSVPQDGIVQATLESTVSEHDSMLALSAVVSREGVVSDLSVLTNTRDRRQVSSLLDAISQARLEPAEFAGSPVAVNLVWLLAQTTVKGKIRS